MRADRYPIVTQVHPPVPAGKRVAAFALGFRCVLRPGFRYRFLFEQMVRRELRQKYKGSVLGVFWYLLNPIVLMGAYLLVFSVLLKVADIPDYPLFVVAGMIVWVFFAQAMLAAAPSMEQNAPLVRKVKFPRESIPAATAVVQLFTFL